MAHYRIIQVSERPLSKEDIKNFSIGDNDLSDFYPDYWGDKDKGDALEHLRAAFGDSIVKHTDKYIVIDRIKLGAILTKKFESWRSELAAISFSDAIGKFYCSAMHPVRTLSTGDAIYEEGRNGCGEQTWDYLTDMYLNLFKIDGSDKHKKTFKLYYGASIDFHV